MCVCVSQKIKNKKSTHQTYHCHLTSISNNKSSISSFQLLKSLMTFGSWHPTPTSITALNQVDSPIHITKMLEKQWEWLILIKLIQKKKKIFSIFISVQIHTSSSWQVVLGIRHVWKFLNLLPMLIKYRKARTTSLCMSRQKAIQELKAIWGSKWNLKV